jgi:hypothetical protein
MSSTLYANRFDHDDVLFRSIKLAGMLAVVGMAASVAEATGKHATAFVLSYVAIRVLLLVQYARAHRHVEAARGGIRIYLLGTGAGAALWLASLAVDGPARYGLWALGLLVDAAAPLLVTASRTQVPLHLEHLPDRFSLFVILVLGESVAAVAHGVHDASWAWGRSSPAPCASSSPRRCGGATSTSPGAGPSTCCRRPGRRLRHGLARHLRLRPAARSHAQLVAVRAVGIEGNGCWRVFARSADACGPLLAGGVAPTW